MSTYSHIASFIVHCLPERLTGLTGKLHRPPLTEVTHSSPNGKLVVVVERGSAREVTQLADELSLLDGVLNVSMVYHQIELAEDLEEVVSP